MTTIGMIKYNPLAELAVPATGQAHDEQAREFCRQAAALFEAGDLTGAANTVGKALQLNNQIKWVFYITSVCLARLGRFDDALQFLEVELQTANPHRRAAKLRDDIIQLQQRDTTQAAGHPLHNTTPFKGHDPTIQPNVLESWLN